jgi:hypothetical protein
MQIAAAWCLLAIPASAQLSENQPPEDLLEAARKGLKEQVQKLLAKGAVIEIKDKEGRTPLLLAAQYNRISTVKLLLAKGANPDARDSRGWNAFMLALMAPSGGVVPTPHNAVLKLLPQPARFRVAVEAAWAPGKATFSSCFMRPEQLAQHIRDIRPDSLVLDAFQHFTAASGRDLIAIVHAAVHGTEAIEDAKPPDDADAVLMLRVEPGISCVQQSDRLSLLIHARLVRKQDQAPVLDKDFGGGMQFGMREELAANPNQHAPLYEAWAKSQAGPIYWAALAALMQR